MVGVEVVADGEQRMEKMMMAAMEDEGGEINFRIRVTISVKERDYIGSVWVIGFGFVGLWPVGFGFRNKKNKMKVG